MLNKVAEKMQVIHLENTNLNNESQIIDSSKQHELDLIHEVFEYILTHLEEPLPSTKELSKMFGTNEFTLKQNFRSNTNFSLNFYDRVAIIIFSIYELVYTFFEFKVHASN